ncbi:hypothetical protein FRC14_006104 [Serendipita sp. 396]|nr:hypothetical protein FRC14_006104 [Serendipita sp. 396]
MTELDELSSHIASLEIGSSVPLRSEFRMPLLGLGVYQVTKPETISACLAAFEAGYRHIDSAQVYRNEAEVGIAFRQSGLRREDVFVTSKVNSRNHGFDKATEWIDKSLRNFQMDYIDLFLIHDPFSGKERRLETWRALIKARDEGKIRSIGVSNYSILHLEEIKKADLELPVVNQLEIHPFCQQRPIVEWCRNHRVFVQAYCPLLRGQRWDNDLLVALSQKYNKSVPQILVRWSLQAGYSPLPKSTRAERIMSNARVFDFEIEIQDMVQLELLDIGDQGAVSWNPTYAP